MEKLAGMLIEVVDRSPLFRKILCKTMEDNGFTVCEAANGREAVEVFDRESPKLVLMSYEMPIMNGIEACKHIRKIDRDEYSPVIIITSNDSDAFISAAFDAGAADYITKPVKWQLLLHRIRYMLKMSRVSYALESSEQRFRQLFDDSPLPYQSLNEHGEIVDVNTAWLEMMGRSSDEVIGASFGNFMTVEMWDEFLDTFPDFIKSGKLTNMCLQVCRADGRLIDAEINGRVAYNADGNFKQTHETLQNITERKAMEDHLRCLATTDPLTGLNNRRAFYEKAEFEQKKALRFKHAFSMLMLDIDHFKAVNDTYGHDVGDKVLKKTTAVFQEGLRDIDILGRLGGEEFGIALPETSLSQALLVAERIRSSIEVVAVYADRAIIDIKISIGVTTLTDAKESVELLLSQADTLLYQAKDNGRNRVESVLAEVLKSNCA